MKDKPPPTQPDPNISARLTPTPPNSRSSLSSLSPGPAHQQPNLTSQIHAGQDVNDWDAMPGLQNANGDRYIEVILWPLFTKIKKITSKN